MRLKLIALASVVALVLPTLALAAYNDVTLTTDAVISVGGYTLNVSGSSAVIESIVVDTGSFSVTLGSGSAITISSPTLQQLSSDVTSDVASDPCTGSDSSISLAYSGAGTVTNVITPSATICTGSGSTPTPAPSGGGGGQIVGSSPTAPGYVNTNPTGTTSVVFTPAPIKPPTSASSATVPRSLTPSSPSFPKNRQLWDAGPDILMLQQFLNTHGYVLTPTGNGSPGNETDIFGPLTYRALIKFQKATNLPATGYLGPLTRAALALPVSGTSTSQ